MQYTLKTDDSLLETELQDQLGLCVRVCMCVWGWVFSPFQQCAIDALCRLTTVPYIAFRAASMINLLTVSLPYHTLSWQLYCILHA